MKTIDELNQFIACTYGDRYSVIAGHGKYGLMDDELGFNIPLVISDNQDDLIDYLETHKDDDDDGYDELFY